MKQRISYDKIKVIAFDADDTLWVNETYFRDGEKKVVDLLTPYETPNNIQQEIHKTNVGNLKIYGYGAKAFVLSMIECALKVSNHTISAASIQKIVNVGKELLSQPIELLDGVEETLQQLQERGANKYRLVVVTKGDLLDQERKLKASNLTKYFHHIEVVSEKGAGDYQKLVQHLDIEPHEFLMIGNSLKSDILPVLEMGAAAIHIPFHTTWAHEQVHQDVMEGKEYETLLTMSEIIPLLL